MTANILMFEARATRDGVGLLEPGDLLVTCVNASIGLWAAWPVASVSASGAPLAVRTPGGVHRPVTSIATGERMLGFRRADLPEGAIERLAYRTWTSAEDAKGAVLAVNL